MPGYVIGGIGPIVVAAALVPLRDEIDNANLALAMVVVVVVAAAVGGRGAGLLAAVIATISYDFFLTRPYLSLTIDSADDVETTIFLLAIGLLVGEIVVRSRRTHWHATRGASEIARLHRVAELAASGAPLEELEASVVTELVGLLDLRDCSFEGMPVGRPLPRLERNGAITGATEHRFSGEEFVLPPELELPVLGPVARSDASCSSPIPQPARRSRSGPSRSRSPTSSEPYLRAKAPQPRLPRLRQCHAARSASISEQRRASERPSPC